MSNIDLLRGLTVPTKNEDTDQIVDRLKGAKPVRKKQISFYISPELEEWLMAIKRKTDLSMTQVIEKLLEGIMRDH